MLGPGSALVRTSQHAAMATHRMNAYRRRVTVALGGCDRVPSPDAGARSTSLDLIMLAARRQSSGYTHRGRLRERALRGRSLIALRRTPTVAGPSRIVQHPAGHLVEKSRCPSTRRLDCPKVQQSRTRGSPMRRIALILITLLCLAPIAAAASAKSPAARQHRPPKHRSPTSFRQALTAGTACVRTRRR